MLPSAKRSLIDGGNSPKNASWILIACFAGGVVGIQALSRVLHQFMPSHVVDCEHNHDEEANEEAGHHNQHDDDDNEDQVRPPSPPETPSRRSSLLGHLHRTSSHHVPLIRQHSEVTRGPQMVEVLDAPSLVPGSHEPTVLESGPMRPPSMPRRLTRKLSQLTSGVSAACECGSSCYGYTDPCGNECFKRVSDRGGFKARVRATTLKPPLRKTATSQALPTTDESTPLLSNTTDRDRPNTEHASRAPTRYYTVREELPSVISEHSSGTLDNSNGTTGNDTLHKTQTIESTSSQNKDFHHHHVPTNAFLSIGLQTSIAIALHKLPEGFITYATNHANPQLGVSVFLALFIHNITEGFAMALPLYLAIQSRIKAMAISFALGGLSQPLGAGIAAIWFHLAGDGNWAPDESVYGGMFAVTAGIMASVALQLFSESLDLTHSKGLCLIGAFSGMFILGISSALTA